MNKITKNDIVFYASMIWIPIMFLLPLSFVIIYSKLFFLLYLVTIPLACIPLLLEWWRRFQ